MSSTSVAAATGSLARGAGHRASKTAGLLRRSLRVLSAVSPSSAAAWANRIWFRVPNIPVDASDLDFLESGERFTLEVHGVPIAAWSWGEGPAVLLAHGWGGSAVQMRAFVEPLMRNDFRAVAFDAPRHGASGGDRGGRDSRGLLEFVAALLAVAKELGAVHAVIAHSGGATAAALALREGLRLERAAFIAPLNDLHFYAQGFCRALGLSERAIDLTMERARHQIGRDWRDLETVIAPREIGVPPLLVVHDRRDREVPFADGAAVAKAWPDAVLHPTEGLGHSRLLRDADVVVRVTAFVTSPG